MLGLRLNYSLAAGSCARSTTGSTRSSASSAIRQRRRAGRVLDDALDAPGIDRSTTYVTNAVKHFKWQARGKRRIHQKPNWVEMTACRPWLETELAVVRPRLVLLGATAAQTLLGRRFRVTQFRGKLVESDLAEFVTATVHPSSILRGEPEQREQAFAALVDDLRFAGALLS